MLGHLVYLHKTKSKLGICLFHCESMPLVSPVINHSRKGAVVVFAVYLVKKIVILWLAIVFTVNKGWTTGPIWGNML